MNAYMGDALDEQGVDLLLSMLRYNPDERVSVCYPHAVLGCLHIATVTCHLDAACHCF